MNLDAAIAALQERRESVPKPVRLPTNDEVDAAEVALGVTFHADYRRFQLTASDIVFGHLEPARLLPDTQPYLDLLKLNERARDLGLPPDCVAFCFDNGNYYFITPSGDIGYLDHDDQTANVHKANLANWIIEEWLEIEDE